jgi:xanthine dehydrogenase accessory factor
MLVDHDGLNAGTVGGGKLEAYALRSGAELLADTEPSRDCTLRVVNLQRDLGMSCGGEVTLLFERIVPPRWRVAIFGAGHVSQAVVSLLRTLQCQLDVFDTRAKWIDAIAPATHLRAQVVEALEPCVDALASKTFVLVMTQGHSTDYPVLVRALARDDLAFVGVLGSAVKASKLRRELLQAGLPPLRVEALHCPVGLPIGDNTPAEIAVSVVAQLLSLRDSARSA